MRIWPSISGGRTIRPSHITTLQDAVDEIDVTVATDIPLAGIEGALEEWADPDSGSVLGNARKLVANVADYGAVGDGVTDDTAAFDAAIAYLSSTYTVATGDQSGYTSETVAVLEIPGGKWMAHEIDLPDYIHVRGMGAFQSTVAYNGAGGAGSYLFGLSTANVLTWFRFEGLRAMGFDNTLTATDPIAENILRLDARGLDFNLILRDCNFMRCFGDAVYVDYSTGTSFTNLYVERCRWDSVGGWAMSFQKFVTGMESRPFVIRDWTYDNGLSASFLAAATAQGYYDVSTEEWGYGLLGLGISSGTNAYGFDVTIENGRFESNDPLRSFDGGRQLVYFNNTSTNQAIVKFSNVMGFFQQRDGAYFLRAPGGNVFLDMEHSGMAYAQLVESSDYVRGESSQIDGALRTADGPSGHFNRHGGIALGDRVVVSLPLAPGAGGSADTKTFLQGDIWFNGAAPATGPQAYVNTSTGVSINTALQLTADAVVVATDATVTLATTTDARRLFTPGLNITLAGAGVASADLATSIVSYDADNWTIEVADVPSTSVDPCVITATPATWCKAFVSYLTGSTTWNPDNVADGDTTTTTVAVTGAALGDFVEVSASIDLTGCILSGAITATDVLTLRLFNPTGSGVNLGSMTVRYRTSKP